MSKFKGKDVEEWSVKEVSLWLESIHMDKYSPAFAEVDGKILCEITEEELENTYRVKKMAHRKKICRRLMFAQSRRNTNTNGGTNKNSGREKHRNSEKDSFAATSSSDPISLHIYGIKYEYNCCCTFCQELTKYAVAYCLECKEFLCGFCDENVHCHAKRKHHHRAAISKYDLLGAGQAVINFFRFLWCRNVLRNKVRETFHRFYDPKTRRHYYENHLTRKIQWNKPYSLGSEELRPFLTSQEATLKIQALLRCRRAYEVVISLIQQQYAKIFDRNEGRFYYNYCGVPNPTPDNYSNRVKSILVTETESWVKPINLHSNDLKAVFNNDIAAIRMQSFFRLVTTTKLIKSLVRKHYEYNLDQLSGRRYFYNPQTGTRSSSKPFLLGSEKWDPNDVRLWNVDEVVVFFRTLGFANFGFIDDIRRFSIDGLLLLTFEWEDYINLGVMKSIQVKKILLEIQHRNIHNKHIHDNEDLRRRDKYRRHHKMVSATVQIQTYFRRLGGQGVADRMHSQQKLQKWKEISVRVGKEGNKWWSDMIPQQIVSQKQFGKRAPFKGTKGWGRYSGDKWTSEHENDTNKNTHSQRCSHN